MTRPHPLGLTSHPEWARVEDRYNELWCNAVMRRMQEREAANPAPARLSDHVVRGIGIAASFIVCAGYVSLFWIVLT